MRPSAGSGVSAAAGCDGAAGLVASGGAAGWRAPAAATPEEFAKRGITEMPGDGVLYQGVHHHHGRTMPNPNRWSAHLFLFWVERDGPFAQHTFDAERLEGDPLQRRRRGYCPHRFKPALHTG